MSKYSNDKGVEAFSVFLYLVNVCLFFLCGQWVVTYYYLSNTAPIQRRRPMIVVTSGILSTIFVSWDRTIFLLFAQSSCCADPYPHWEGLYMVEFHLLVTGSFFLVFYRVYLTWFDIKWNMALEDAKWRVHIEKDYKETNFFLAYRTTFGSRKYVGIVCIVVTLFFALFGGIECGINGFTITNRLLIFFAASLTFIPVSIIYCKQPPYDDVFGIRRELKHLSLCFLIGLPTYFGYILGVRPERGTYAYIFWQILGQVIVMSFLIIQFPLVLIQFKLPPTLWHLRLEWRKLHSMREKSISTYGQGPTSRTRSSDASQGPHSVSDGTRDGNLSVPTRSDESVTPQSGVVVTPPSNSEHHTQGSTAQIVALSQSAKKIKHSINRSINNLTETLKLGSNPQTLTAKPRKISLGMVLETDDGFSFFCRHLCAEFSAENILFLVETQQYYNELRIKYPRKTKAHKLLDIGVMDEAEEKEIVIKSKSAKANAGKKLLSIKLPKKAVPPSDIVHSTITVVEYPDEDEPETEYGKHPQLTPQHSPAPHRPSTTSVRGRGNTLQSQAESTKIESKLESKTVTVNTMGTAIVHRIKSMSAGDTSILGSDVHGDGLVDLQDMGVKMTQKKKYDDWEQAVMLFQKYIDSEHAYFSVNISSGCRVNLYKALHFDGKRYTSPRPLMKADEENPMGRRNSRRGTVICESFPYTDHVGGADILREWIEGKDLIEVFDESRREIWKLLQDSYSRFIMSKAFREWCAITYA